jgi:hypothetical protein
VPKKEVFKGEPEATYVINDAEGEIKFTTDKDGKHIPKNERERVAIERVLGLTSAG